MRQAVSFDEFAYACPHSFSSEANNGYGCKHPKQEETVLNKETNQEEGLCYCHTCPLGIEAEQEDLTDTTHPDAVTDTINWDGLCDDNCVEEGEILLVNYGEDRTEDEKNALFSYELYINRYNKEWLDKHNIENLLCD